MGADSWTALGTWVGAIAAGASLVFIAVQARSAVKLFHLESEPYFVIDRLTEALVWPDIWIVAENEDKTSPKKINLRDGISVQRSNIYAYDAMDSHDSVGIKWAHDFMTLRIYNVGRSPAPDCKISIGMLAMFSSEGMEDKGDAFTPTSHFEKDLGCIVPQGSLHLGILARSFEVLKVGIQDVTYKRRPDQRRSAQFTSAPMFRFFVQGHESVPEIGG